MNEWCRDYRLIKLGSLHLEGRSDHRYRLDLISKTHGLENRQYNAGHVMCHITSLNHNPLASLWSDQRLQAIGELLCASHYGQVGDDDQFYARMLVDL